MNTATARNLYQGTIQVEAYFERAIEQANVGLLHLAVDTAREALIFAKRRNHPLVPRIHRLLAFLLMDLGQAEQAKLHTWYAIRALRSTSVDYHIEREMLELLLERIKRMARERDERPSTPLAA